MKHSTETGKPHAAAHFLREQSPIVVAHLAEGCSTCAAGLEVFQKIDTPDASRKAVLELFERELFAMLQASGNAVHALHSALAGVATTQPERAAD
ncbi:MAG TPA: hypothetical protein VEW48_21435 [Thermoanaerobaculia bacterium]|nr:hypothetical protein [Thermoanaerobaculia bacterium]